MNQQKIDIVTTDDWQTLYINGEKVTEVFVHEKDGGLLTAFDILHALNIPYEHYEVNHQEPKDYFADLKL